MAERFPIQRQVIDLKDPRDVKSLEILGTHPFWEEVEHSRLGGAKAYAIPSSSRAGVTFHVDLDDCECEDYRYRGQTCAHIRAVRLYVNIIHSHVQRAAHGIERTFKQQRAKRPLTIF